MQESVSDRTAHPQEIEATNLDREYLRASHGELIKIRKGIGGFALITIILLILILIYK